MRKIRVLVLSHMFPKMPGDYSGIFILEQVRHLLKKGIDARVACPVPWSPRLLWFREKWRDYGKTPAHNKLNEVHVDYPRYLCPSGIWLYPWSGTIMVSPLNKLMERSAQFFKPDLIHAHTLIPGGQAAMIAGAKHRLPVVCTAHGGDVNMYPRFSRTAQTAIRRVIAGVDRLVTVSSDLAKKVEAIRPKPNQVIHNGVDTERFSDLANFKESARLKLGIKPEAKVVLFVGSYLKSKGVFELVEVFGDLAGKNSELLLAMVGGGPEYDAILSCAGRLGILERIYLTGPRPYEEIPEWLRACDIFVLPSDSEGLPCAMLEAMSSARPVVATRVGGIPEAMENGKTGYLVEKGDRSGLREALDRLLADPAKSREMGCCGRETVVKHFSWDKNAEEHSRLYLDVIERRIE
jgi:teichuronic acid biosynthesis glycosyltransferase TuaC